MNYNSYLKSDEWKEKKRELAKVAGKKMCWVCYTKERLNVHHLTYARVGKEDTADLIYLCANHHKLLHQLKKGCPNKSDLDVLKIVRRLWGRRLRRERLKKKPEIIIKKKKKGRKGIVKKIKKLRISGLSIKEIAERLDCSKEYITTKVLQYFP